MSNVEAPDALRDETRLNYLKINELIASVSKGEISDKEFHKKYSNIILDTNPNVQSEFILRKYAKEALVNSYLGDSMNTERFFDLSKLINKPQQKITSLRNLLPNPILEQLIEEKIDLDSCRTQCLELIGGGNKEAEEEFNKWRVDVAIVRAFENRISPKEFFNEIANIYPLPNANDGSKTWWGVSHSVSGRLVELAARAKLENPSIMVDCHFSINNQGATDQQEYIEKIILVKAK